MCVGQRDTGQRKVINDVVTDVVAAQNYLQLYSSLQYGSVLNTRIAVVRVGHTYARIPAFRNAGRPNAHESTLLAAVVGRTSARV